MKLYLKVIVLVTVLLAEVGLVLPFLFSAASTELVIFGWLLVVVTVPATYYAANNIFKTKLQENV